ncbi:Hypothetical predicted protein [Prunus dulcis]|uniref:Uncharacterized protein n=1 Tax=Prunus dulcis TaxID=3755 RepID=A0A5E4ELA1_PRUDU|nr:Hypothetical predicted protein [Prunus dulcis]
MGHQEIWVVSCCQWSPSRVYRSGFAPRVPSASMSTSASITDEAIHAPTVWALRFWRDITGVGPRNQTGTRVIRSFSNGPHKGYVWWARFEYEGPACVRACSNVYVQCGTGIFRA